MLCVQEVEFAENDPIVSAITNILDGKPLTDIIPAVLTVLCQSIYLQSGCDAKLACETIGKILTVAQNEIMMNEGLHTSGNPS